MIKIMLLEDPGFHLYRSLAQLTDLIEYSAMNKECFIASLLAPKLLCIFYTVFNLYFKYLKIYYLYKNHVSKVL